MIRDGKQAWESILLSRLRDHNAHQASIPDTKCATKP